MNIPPATLTPLVLAGASAETRERAQRWTDVVKRMARLSEISFADRAPMARCSCWCAARWPRCR